MPALNIAANQILPTPVSDMYRNRAIQAQTAAVEKQTEQADAILALEQGKAQTAAQNASLRAGEYSIKAAEYVAAVGERQAKEEAMGIAAITAGAGKSDDPLGYAHTELSKFTESLPKGKTKTGLQKILEDHIVTAEEMAAMNTVAEIILNDEYKVDKQSDYTLGNGRYSGETNELIAGVAPTEGNDLDQREQSIQDSMRLFGLTRAEAVKREDGLLKVTTSPDSRGNITITDLSTEPPTVTKRSARGTDQSTDSAGTIGEGTDQPWDTPVGRVNVSGSLDSSVIAKEQNAMLVSDIALMAALEVSSPDFEEGVGAASILQRGVNSVLQAVSFNALPRIFAEETAAADQLRKFNQSVRASLTTSDRGAVWDLKMVERLLPDPDNIFKDPEGEAIKFTQTVQAVSQKRENNVAALNGRKPKLIDRKRLGTKNDPLIAVSMEEAEKMAADPRNEGSFVMVGGRTYPIEPEE